MVGVMISLKDLHGGMTSMEGFKGNNWKDDLHDLLMIKDLHGGIISMEGQPPWRDDLHGGI